MIYFIIGFMGSGKSTLGRVLARSISARFIDLDSYIEHQEGMSVSQIFEKGKISNPTNVDSGSEHFRSIERDTLHSIVLEHMSNAKPSDNLVISCGGGTPCYHGNMPFMNHNGITIHLDMSTERLLSRLKNNRKNRPLLANLSDQDLKTHIEQMIHDRQPYYTQCQLRILNCERNGRELIELVQQTDGKQ